LDDKVPDISEDDGASIFKVQAVCALTKLLHQGREHHDLSERWEPLAKQGSIMPLKTRILSRYSSRNLLHGLVPSSRSGSSTLFRTSFSNRHKLKT